MNQPALSVVIAVYPTLDFLPRALKSIYYQELKDIEVIVVLDGIEKKPDRQLYHHILPELKITFIEHEANRSALQAYLTGIRAATGKYITFIDSDDEVSEVYKGAVEKAEAGQYDIVGFHMDCRRMKWDCELTGNDAIMRHFYYKHGHCMGNKVHYIYRKDVMDKGLAQMNLPSIMYLNFAEDNLLLLAPMSVATKMLEDYRLGTYIYHKDNPNSTCTRARKTRTQMGSARHQKQIVDRTILNYCRAYHITKKDVGYDGSPAGNYLI